MASSAQARSRLERNIHMLSVLRVRASQPPRAERRLVARLLRVPCGRPDRDAHCIRRATPRYGALITFRPRAALRVALTLIPEVAFFHDKPVGPEPEQ